ncbi:hypothetical protein SHKM778_32040 [Streptomyces sp. KM77-8]|uniref:Uncharacterized protein n=1 Tax=Streptomyces haneummycinicus TaxID=3074435 RepID=A0AAT9HH41_9ACTN
MSLPLAQRVTRSAATLDTPTSTLDGFREWWGRQQAGDTSRVERIAFDELRSWSFDARTGNLAHDTGGFTRSRACACTGTPGPSRPGPSPSSTSRRPGSWASSSRSSTASCTS